MPAITLIDDDKEHLDRLQKAVEAAVGEKAFEVQTWVPVKGDPNVASKFQEQVAFDTALVVTDYDLTPALDGLFGTSVVAWCQRLALPVADYSRGDQTLLPTIPDVFEFRLPKETELAAEEIVSIAEGFADLRKAIDADPVALEAQSPAAMLAQLLGRPEELSSFALYELQVGSYRSLLKKWIDQPQKTTRSHIAAYMLGHLLFNLVLRYPGPILDRRATAGYFAVSPEGAISLYDAIAPARYVGPFSRMGSYFWRSDVDELAGEWSGELEVEDHDDLAIYRRNLLEAKLGEKLPRHDCERCHGERGGYVCPFTDRVVCERDDCSVGTTSWLPHGAEIARVERDYYDETEPMLGF